MALIRKQVGILVDQRDQEPVFVRVVVYRNLHPPVSVSPEVSVFGHPSTFDFQMARVLLEKSQSLLEGGLGHVFGQNVFMLAQS